MSRKQLALLEPTLVRQALLDAAVEADAAPWAE